MLILQASYTPESAPSLLLWGEVPRHTGGFAAPARLLPGPAKAEKAYLWQPARGGVPVPSQPGLLDGLETGKGKLQLERFKYPVRRLDWRGLRDLEEGDGVFFGSTLRFWRQLWRFAAELVARQRFLPGLNGWDCHLGGEDRQHLEQLSRAMPAACRAMGEEQPHYAPSGVATRVINGWADALIRESAAPAGGTQSVHDRWLRALTAAKADWDPGQELPGQIRSWRQSLSLLGSSPYRLLLRLEEPVGQQKSWMVRYLLQPTSDPSLLLETNQAEGAAREALLLALGQAAGLDPNIEASLKGKIPQGYCCDLSGAHRFLAEFAPLLQQADYAVQLPAWWSSSRSRPAVRARARSPALHGESGLSLDRIIDVDWEVVLGPHVLTRAELAKLARLKQPLVQVRGEWVYVHPEELQKALQAFEKHRQLSVSELLALSLGRSDAGGLELQEVHGEGWVGDFLGRLQGSVPLEQRAVPQEFMGELRPYQVRGYSWMAFMRQWGLGACLADDMGLGKTVQTLCLLQAGWNEVPAPSLLVCPTSVLGNWAKECRRFTPQLATLVHHGPQRGALQTEGVALVITSYTLLQRDREQFEKVRWSAIILDEAQNIKNSNARQSQAARAIGAGFRLALTGTPVENHVGDLWALSEFWQPGLLGPAASFKRKFQIPIQRQRDPQAAERLKRLTGPFILRRLKTDKSILADLPEKQEMKVYCSLTAEQASLYAAVVSEVTAALETAEGISRKGLVLATLTRLKQVCNHPAHFLNDNSPLENRSGKLERLLEMLREVLELGERALIFTQFTTMGSLLCRHLQNLLGKEVLYLHGALPKKQRDEMVDRFQSGGPQLFLLSLKAGGVGLNLTAANHVFHFDRWWNPAVENQATDRAFRLGQTRNVQVHKFLCLGTVEEKIDEMIESKLALAGQLVGTGENWVTELSTEDLKELFRLRQEVLV